MRNAFFYFLLSGLFMCACTNNAPTEKTQNSRNNIIDVTSKVKEIVIDDVLIGSYPHPYIANEYLFICDPRSMDKQIHIFDKEGFNYLASTGYKGEGPNEIAGIGHIAMNENDRLFYVSDHGKQAIYTYEIDSVIANPYYEHKLKTKINKNIFPSNYQYINDTLCIGRMIRPIGNADFRPYVGKWNMITGEIKTMKYEHPDVEKKRILCDVSINDNLYLESHLRCDLLTICNLNGELQCNIYGKNWKGERGMEYYHSAKFTNDGIIALYFGENMLLAENKNIRPTKFLYFNKKGDYICTLETGYRIDNFCYDNQHNRIIMSLDDDIQFAYLDLNDIHK